MDDIKEVELLNMTDDAMEETKIEVVNYMTLVGVEIDRDSNFEKGMHTCSKVAGKEDHLAITPSDMEFSHKFTTLL